MVQMDAFKDSNGKIDFTAHNRAQVENGDTCSACGHCILFPTGHRDVCPACRTFLVDDGEVYHERAVRCPACRHQIATGCLDDNDIYDEGEHGVWCSKCDAEFTVRTRVSYEFVSPPMDEEPKEGDDAKTDPQG